MKLLIFISLISVAIAPPPVVPRPVTGTTVNTIPIGQPMAAGSVAIGVPIRPPNNPALANGGISNARAAQHVATTRDFMRALELQRVQPRGPAPIRPQTVITSPANGAANSRPISAGLGTGLSSPIQNPNTIGAGRVVPSRLGSASSISSTSSGVSRSLVSGTFAFEILSGLGLLVASGIAAGVAVSQTGK
ncbi:hypothetical protein MP638_005883 [Amoeboaphelidium occidentale]|nr:hypothetical protein MP638_005883 [Amoeboaphelidium occidentale]